MPVSQHDLDWFAVRLLIAIYDTNREFRMQRQWDLRQKFGAPDLTIAFAGPVQTISLEGRDFTISSMASDEQIAAEIAKIRAMSQKPEAIKPMTTIAEQLKAARAKLTEAREAAANAVAESADASRVVLQEVEKARKEAADLRAEVAELTNGGPA